MDSVPKMNVSLSYSVLIHPLLCTASVCVYMWVSPIPPEFLSELNEAE